MDRKLMVSPFLQTRESRAAAFWYLPGKKLKVLGKQVLCFSSLLGMRRQEKQSQDICLLVTELDREALPVQPKGLARFILYQAKPSAL